MVDTISTSIARECAHCVMGVIPMALYQELVQKIANAIQAERDANVGADR